MSIPFKDLLIAEDWTPSPFARSASYKHPTSPPTSKNMTQTLRIVD